MYVCTPTNKLPLEFALCSPYNFKNYSKSQLFDCKIIKQHDTLHIAYMGKRNKFKTVSFV